MEISPYVNKIKSLQQYNPFLNGVIGKLERCADQSRAAQLSKLKQIRNIINDENSRKRYEVLLKCEKILERLYQKIGRNSDASGSKSISKNVGIHIPDIRDSSDFDNPWSPISETYDGSISREHSPQPGSTSERSPPLSTFVERICHSPSNSSLSTLQPRSPSPQYHGSNFLHDSNFEESRSVSFYGKESGFGSPDFVENEPRIIPLERSNQRYYRSSSSYDENRRDFRHSQEVCDMSRTGVPFPERDNDSLPNALPLSSEDIDRLISDLGPSLGITPNRCENSTFLPSRSTVSDTQSVDPSRFSERCSSSSSSRPSRLEHGRNAPNIAIPRRWSGGIRSKSSSSERMSEAESIRRRSSQHESGHYRREVRFYNSSSRNPNERNTTSVPQSGSRNLRDYEHVNDRSGINAKGYYGNHGAYESHANSIDSNSLDPRLQYATPSTYAVPTCDLNLAERVPSASNSGPPVKMPDFKQIANIPLNYGGAITAMNTDSHISQDLNSYFKCLLLKNLSRTVSRHDIVRFFNGFGMTETILQTDISSHCTGIGYAQFVDHEEAKRALNFSVGKSINGQCVQAYPCDSEVFSDAKKVFLSSNCQPVSNTYPPSIPNFNCSVQNRSFMLDPRLSSRRINVANATPKSRDLQCAAASILSQTNPYNKRDSSHSMVTDPRVLAKLAHEKSQRTKDRRNASIEENKNIRKSKEIDNRKTEDIVQSKKPSVSVSSSTQMKKSTSLERNVQLFKPASLTSFKIPKIKRQNDQIPESSSCTSSECFEIKKPWIAQSLPKSNQEPEISSTVLSDDLLGRKKIQKRKILSSDSDSENEVCNLPLADVISRNDVSSAITQKKPKSSTVKGKNTVPKVETDVTSGQTDLLSAVNKLRGKTVPSVSTGSADDKNDESISSCQSFDASLADVELCEIQVQSDEADDNDDENSFKTNDEAAFDSVSSPKRLLPVESTVNDSSVSETGKFVKKNGKSQSKKKRTAKKKVGRKTKKCKSVISEKTPCGSLPVPEKDSKSVDGEFPVASNEAENPDTMVKKPDSPFCTESPQDVIHCSEKEEQLPGNVGEQKTEFESIEKEKMQECLQRKLVVKLTKAVGIGNDTEYTVHEPHSDESKDVLSSKSTTSDKFNIEKVTDDEKCDNLKIQYSSKARKGLVSPSRCHVCSFRSSSLLKHYLAQHPNDVFPVKLSQAFLKIVLEEELGPAQEIVPDDLTKAQLALIQEDDFSWIPESIIFENIINCRYCDYYAVCKLHLIDHVSCHKRSGKSMPQKYFFACRFCDCKCATAQIMYDHLCWHTGELRYSCCLCGFKTSNILNLKNHHLSNHSERNTGIIRVLDDNLHVGNTWVYAYACKICRFAQLKEERVRLHVESQHPSHQDAIIKFNVVSALTDDDPQYNRVLQSFFQKKDQLEAERLSHSFIDSDLVFTTPDDVINRNITDQSDKAYQMKQIVDAVGCVVSANNSEILDNTLSKVMECRGFFDGACELSDNALIDATQPSQDTSSNSLNEVENQQEIMDTASSNTVDDVIMLDSMSTSSLEWDTSSEASFSACDFSDSEFPPIGGELEPESDAFSHDIVKRLSNRVLNVSQTVCSAHTDESLPADVSRTDSDVQRMNSVPDICRSLLQDFERFEQDDSCQKPPAIRVRRFSGDTLSTFQESPPLKISNIVSLSGSASECMSSDVAVCAGISEKSSSEVPSSLSPVAAAQFDSADAERPWRRLLTLKDSAEVLRLMYHVHHRSVYKCGAVHCSFTANSGLLFRLHLNLPKHLNCQLCRRSVTSSRAISADADCNCSVTRLVCVYCGYSGRDLPEHVYRRHSASRLQCGYCFYRTSNEVYIHDHQRRWHKHVPPYFLKSDLSNPPPGLSQADTVASEEYPLSSLWHYSCSRAGCGVKVFKAVDLLYHYAKDHPSVKSFDCALCQFICSSLIELIHHYISHQYLAYCCTYCQFSSHCQREMKIHLIDFHPDDLPKCRCRITKEICEKIELQFPPCSSQQTESDPVSPEAAASVAVKQEPVAEPGQPVPAEVEEVDAPQLKIQRCQSLALEPSADSASLDPQACAENSDTAPAVSQTCVDQSGAEELPPDTRCEQDPLALPESAAACEGPLSQSRCDAGPGPLSQGRCDAGPDTLSQGQSGIGSGPLSQGQCDVEPGPLSQGQFDVEPGLLSESQSDARPCLPEPEAPGDEDSGGENAPPPDGLSNLSGPQLYRCGNAGCGACLANYKLFREHLTACPLRGAEYLCAHCGLRLGTASRLLEHLQEHGPQRYRCFLCPRYRANSTVAVRKHLRAVHRVQHRCFSQATPRLGGHVVFSSKCVPVSAATVADSGQQRPGAQEQSRLFSPDQLADLPRRPVLSQLLGCRLCSYRTHVTRNLTRHLQGHGSEQETGQQEGDPVNPRPCIGRGSRMSDLSVNLAASSSSTLAEPAEEGVLPREVPEELRYVCSIVDCDYITLNTTMLRYHIQAVHGQLTVYPCPHCREQVSPDSLGNHLRFHAAELYRCQYCPYHHYQRRLVLRHSRARHPALPELAVTVRRPRDQQSPEDPRAAPPFWGCHLCRFQAADRSVLLDHVNTHHSVTAQFMCALCSSGCASLEEVRRHYLQNHSVGEQSASLERVCVTFSLQQHDQQQCEQQQELSHQLSRPLWRREDPARLRHVRGILLEHRRSPVKRRAGSLAGDSPKKQLTDSPIKQAGDTPRKIATDSPRKLARSGEHHSDGEAVAVRRISEDRDVPAVARLTSDALHEEAVISPSGAGSKPSEGELLQCYEDRAVSFGGLGQANLQSCQMVCPRCSQYSTKLAVNMRRHLFKEFAYNRFVCGHCGFAAANRAHVLRHHELAHRGSSLPPSVSVLNVDTQLENWVEAVIGEQTRQLSSNSVTPLAWNEKRPEQNLAIPPRARADSESSATSLPTPPQEGATLHCPQCKYCSTNRARLRKHLIVHFRYIQCDHCPFTSNYRYAMLNHLSSSHASLSPSYHLLQPVLDRLRQARLAVCRGKSGRRRKKPSTPSASSTLSASSTPSSNSASRHQVARKSTARRARAVAVKSTGGGRVPLLPPFSYYGQRPPAPGQFAEVTTQLVMPDGTNMAINVPTLAQIFRLYPHVLVPDIKHCFSV